MQSIPAPAAAFACGLQPQRGAAKVLQFVSPLPTRGRIEVLVVRARFADDPASASDRAHAILDPGLPGSLSHFYTTMSQGRLQVGGTVLPGQFAAPHAAAHYLAGKPGQLGAFDDFARHILEQVDASVDLARFDNDGPDGDANSGDDDGVVDYVFLLLSRVPRGFLVGGATGFAGLRLSPAWVTSAVRSGGGAIRVDGSQFRGALVQEDGFANTVGAMAHELGHGFHLPDLIDTGYSDDPATDSAGIGRWGLMGWGATGWNGGDGPNPFSAFSLEQLGWIGDGNEHLIDVDADRRALPVAPVAAGGQVLRVPLRASFLAPGAVFALEYLLLEYRSRGSHYDRHLPAEGLLVWHVRPDADGGNGHEERKLVDLICADGASHPFDADDLDAWAHDEAYARRHGGNQGDAGDAFDGRRYRRLHVQTSPSAASSGLSIEVRPAPAGAVVDLRLPRWSGQLHGDVEWLGQVTVDGDLTVAPGARLTIYPNTQVQVEADRTAGGLDAQRTEIRIQGTLVVPGNRLTRFERRSYTSLPAGPVVFRCDETAGSWYGVLSDAGAWVDAGPHGLVVQDALLDRITPSADAPSGAGPSTAVSAGGSEAGALRLLSSYPNPFNAATTIAFELPAPQRVRLTVFDALGRPLRILADGAPPAGRHEVTWDGRDDGGTEAASGTYFYQLRIEAGPALNGRMVLAR